MTFAPHHWFELWLVAGAALGLSFLLAAVTSKLGVRDAPDDQRKDHARVVATAGGLAVACSAGAVWTLAGPAAQWLGGGGLSWTSPGLAGWSLGETIWFAGLLGWVAAVGFLDDIESMGPKTKFVLLAAPAAAAGWVFGPDLGSGWLGWFAMAMLAGWCFFLANAVNFMDGADGFAFTSVTAMFAALSWSAWPDAPDLAVLCAALAGASAGFLVWNWPPARLFAGDTGALFAGFALALVGFAGVSLGAWTLAEPLLLAAPFAGDVMGTLLWRARRRRPLMQGHRDHIYQRLKAAAVPVWLTNLAYAALALGGWRLIAPAVEEASLPPGFQGEVAALLFALTVAAGLWLVFIGVSFVARGLLPEDNPPRPAS